MPSRRPRDGFYSTAEDLCRYAAAHFFGDTTLLSDASKREMQQPYWRVAQADTHYGLGFSIQEIDGRRYVGHGGGFPGHATHTLFDPKDRLAVVVLTNLASGPAATLTHAIIKMIHFALATARGIIPHPLRALHGALLQYVGSDGCGRLR